MATAKRTANDYIFEHPESRNLYVRVRDENGRRCVRSLGTTDRRQAELVALPLIREHKARLLANRPRVETVWTTLLEPGLHVNPDGGHVAATERELTYYN